jgi:predicted transcriptional regulator
MKNPSGNKLEKLVFGMFDQMVEGADKYVTKQGSTWLIFTESKKWVIEFTKDKTLWFNYNIFQGELELIGKDCTEERDLIKNWFESRFLNKPKVKHTNHLTIGDSWEVEDTIQNGVKRTFDMEFRNQLSVEDTIQEGVKHTEDMVHISKETVENTIQNGVKYTIDEKSTFRYVVEDTIKNGVKETTPSGYLGSIEMKGKIVHQIESPKQNNEVEDAIQNGVKETRFQKSSNLYRIEDTRTLWGKSGDEGVVEYIIQEGVKNTEWYSGNSYGEVEDTIQNGVKDIKQGTHLPIHLVEDTIQNGVKDIIDPFWVDPVRIKDAIENGVKETKENRLIRTISVISTIKNGVKHVEDGDWLDQDERIDDIIENGVKEIKEISNISLMSEIFKVNSNRAIKDGVKEIQPLPAQDGNRDWGLYYHRQEDRTKPHTEYVKEVIEDSYNHRGRVEGVIRNTDKDGI